MMEQQTLNSSVEEGNNNCNCQLTCFICVQPVTQGDENSDSVWYSLCGILNRLKIKPTTVNEEAGEDLVPLCEKCSKVVRKLSGLCMDLEEVKLKINYYLGELNQLIVLDDKDQQNGSSDAQQDQMKQELKEKCSNVTKKGPSMVVLVSKLDNQVSNHTEEMEVEDDLIPAIPPASTNQIFKWDINYGYDDDDNYEPVNMDEEAQGQSRSTATFSTDDEYEGSDSEEEMEPELRSEYVIIEDPTTKEPGTSGPRPIKKSSTSSAPPPNPAYGKRKRNPKTFNCSECDISYAGPHKLDEHSMIFHPEKYFPPPPPSPQDNSAPTNQRLYLTHLLNTEVDYCKNAKLNCYKCIYCGKLFQNLHKRISILSHLIKNHQEILKLELIQLKKEKSADQIKQVVKMPVFHRPKPSVDSGHLETNCKLKHFREDIKKMKREYSCSNCGVRTTYPRMHHVIYHPEKFLVKFKNCEGDKLFKMYCGYLIYKLVDKFRELEIKKGKGVKVKCPHCNNLYGNGMGCRNHVIFGHVDILGEELKRLQEIVTKEEIGRLVEEKGIQLEVPVERCLVCDVLLTKATVLKHVKRAHPKEYLEKFRHYDCGNCGEPYGSVMGLREHNCRNGRFKEVSVVQRISRPPRGAKGENICGICKRRWDKPWGLRYHFWVSHVDEVFKGVRGEEVDWEGFRKVCVEVMEEEMGGLEAVVCEESFKGKWKCGYCGEIKNTRRLVWVHEVKKHREVLEGKVRRRMEEERKMVGEGGDEENEGEGEEVEGSGVGGKVESVIWEQFYDVGEENGDGVEGIEETGGILEGRIQVEENKEEDLEVEVKEEENYLDGDSVFSY